MPLPGRLSLCTAFLDGWRVVVVEPLDLGGGRFRDMVEMDDGRIVIRTDTRELLMLSNADRR